eukprot:TRINITY_DN2996_c0_g1_i2.p1 TRINITY_DN2996_c0_g1~~TRINITY_DN2996_c0_g1_i2.p1  ORF type:complete len:297 (-),score=76.13 TRINITY_DN2996_c0_g1_i2:120-1010(-)
MLRSLVGSEMCIRDRRAALRRFSAPRLAAAAAGSSFVLASSIRCDDGNDSWFQNPITLANDWLQKWTEPSRDLLLPAWDMRMGPAPRTLVLDLDETLVHTTWDRQHGWRTQKRPYLDKFLKTMSQHFEIVIFSCGLVHTVDPVIGAIDPNQSMVMYRLYRDSTVYRKGEYIKDLSRLNRDLNRVIMIDDNAEHVQDQPENAIVIPKFTGDNSDMVLLQLIPLLKGMFDKDVQDVREEIERYRQGGTTEDLFQRLHAEQLSKYEDSQGKLAGVMKLPGSRVMTVSYTHLTLPTKRIV